MFQKMRAIFLWLHRWVGLTAALLVVVLAATGVVLVFENEIDRMLNPQISYVKPSGPRLSVTDLMGSVRQAFPKERIQNIGFPSDEKLAVQVMLGTGRRVSVDPYTGKVLGSRGFGDSLVHSIRELHVRLLFPPVTVALAKGTRTSPSKVGSQIVGWTTVILLGISITGMFVWFPRMAWKLDPRTGWKRINFDLHNLTGLYTLFFAIVLAVTGIVMSFEAPKKWVYSAFPMHDTDEPPEVELRRGVKMLPVEAAVEAARRTFPGAAVASLNMPSPPNWSYNVAMRFPGDVSVSGRSRVAVDPYTGEVLFKEDYRDEQTAAKILRMMRPLHTGDIFGWPTRILAALASLMIVAQVVTGVIMWVVRSFKSKTKTAVAEPKIEVTV